MNEVKASGGCHRFFRGISRVSSRKIWTHCFLRRACAGAVFFTAKLNKVKRKQIRRVEFDKGSSDFVDF